MWNPFVWHIEVPYTKRQLARMEAERIAWSITAAVPAVPAKMPAAPATMPAITATVPAVPATMPAVTATMPAGPTVLVSVRVAGVTGVTLVPLAAPTIPPVHVGHAGCQQCTANHANAERSAPPLPAPVNAVPAADVTKVRPIAPTIPSVHADRQQTTTNHVKAQESKVKYLRKAAAEERQHPKSQHVFSAFKSTDIAPKVKHVTWAMDKVESSSSLPTSDQAKEDSSRLPPSSASSSSRRAVRVAAKALLEERPKAADDDDSGNDTDGSSAIDTQEIPRSTVYRGGIETRISTHQPEGPDLESDGTSSSAIDDSEGPVGSHFTPNHLTYTRQDKPRKTRHSQRPISQSHAWVNDWKLNTSAASFNTNIIRPRPQLRQAPRSAQRDSDSEDGSDIDDRVPKHRRPATNGIQPQTQNVTESAHGDSDSEHGSDIDDGVPWHRRPTKSGPGPQPRELPPSARRASGRTPGSVITNPVPPLKHPQINPIEDVHSPAPFSAPLHLATAKEKVKRVAFEPPQRVSDNPLLDYHNRIAQYRIQNAYRQGQLHSPAPVTPGVQEEADCRIEVPRGGRLSHPMKGIHNTSPPSSRLQSMSAKKEADHIIGVTRRVVPEPTHQDGWQQQLHSSSSSPSRGQSNTARSNSDIITERPTVASESRSEYCKRSRHRRVGSPSSPPTHQHSRKYRRSRPTSPSTARLDPIIVVRPKGMSSTLKNKRLIFVFRTKAQKEAMLAGEDLHIKQAVSGVEKPPTPFRLSNSDSAKEGVYKMSGGLGHPDKKRPKASSKGKESKYKPPTVESDSDEMADSGIGADVTWRDV